MDFRYRKCNYRVERDSHQFILSKKTGNDYGVVGYFSDAYFLIKKLVSLHCFTDCVGNDILKTIKNTCSTLEKVLNKAVKANPEGVEEEIGE